MQAVAHRAPDAHRQTLPVALHVQIVLVELGLLAIDLEQPLP